MLLSDDELLRLTDYKRPADQRRWLQERGYRFDVGGSGRPKVLKAEVERILTAGKSRRPAPALTIPKRNKKG